MAAGLKRKRRRKNMEQAQNQMSDKNEHFVFRHTAGLLIRHLDRYPVSDKEILSLICWNLGENREDLGEFLMEQFEDDDREDMEKDLSEALSDPWGCGSWLWDIFSKMRSGFHRKMIREIKRLLTLKIEELRYRGKSDLEKNLDVIGEMFDLTEQERRFCIFLFIITNYEPVADYFILHLECHQFSGKRYFCNILDISKNELNDILTGKLEQIGLCDNMFGLMLGNDFRPLFENQSSQRISKNFFVPLNQKSIPLEHHFVGEEKIEHTLALLREKSKSSTHILLYGPPGTGKTSFAAGIARETGISPYGIMRGEADPEQRMDERITGDARSKDDLDHEPDRGYGAFSASAVCIQPPFHALQQTPAGSALGEHPEGEQGQTVF